MLLNRITSQEIDRAARVIEISLIAGRDLGFQNMLRVNFPEATIRAMAEAALRAAHNTDLGVPVQEQH